MKSTFHYVYILESLSKPEHFYVGQTQDLTKRFNDHNAGKSVHTAKHLPWKLKTYVAFSSKTQAKAFEAYLKTASGRAFARKRL